MVGDPQDIIGRMEEVKKQSMVQSKKKGHRDGQ